MFVDVNGLWATYLKLRNGEAYRNRTLAVNVDGLVELDYDFLHQLFHKSGIQSSTRKISESRKGPDAHLYLDGLKWILDMYSRGVCPDYRQ